MKHGKILLFVTIFTLIGCTVYVVDAERGCTTGFCHFNDTDVVTDIAIVKGSFFGSNSQGYITKWNITELCTDSGFSTVDAAYLSFYVYEINDDDGALDNDINISYIQNQTVTASSTNGELDAMDFYNTTTNSTAWAGSSASSFHNLTVTSFVQEACDRSENLTIYIIDPDYDPKPFDSKKSTATSIKIGRTELVIPDNNDTHHGVRTSLMSTASQRPHLFIEFSAGNSNPTLSSAVISSPVNLTDDITCTAVNASDADSDAVTNITVWTSNSSRGPVLVYSFDSETADGEIYRDYSGTGNNGTLNQTGSGAGWRSNGVLGGSFSADGVGDDDFVYVPKDSSLDLGNMTLELWINRTGSWGSGAEGIISKAVGTGWDRNYMIEGRSGGAVRFQVSNGSTNGIKVMDTSIFLNLNEWYHIVATFDNSTRNMSIYINGTLDNSSIIDVYTKASDIDMYIGRLNSSGSDRECDCDLDEVRIYNYTLTPEQIQEHFRLRYNVTSGSMTDAADSWTCRITPNDGTDDGATKENSTGFTSCYTVKNTLTLTENTDDCFEFAQDSAILDCNNYHIYGEAKSQASVTSQNFNNIHIRNCYIQNASTAINVTNTDYSFIENVTLFNTTDLTSGDTKAYGIYMTNSRNSTIHANITIVNSTSTSTSSCYDSLSHGIWLSNIFNVSILNSSIYDVRGQQQGFDSEGCNPSYRPEIGRGMWIEDANNFSILNTTVNWTEQAGIDIRSSSTYANISKCVIQDGNDGGIETSSVDHADVTDNLLINNRYNIKIYSGSNYADIKRNKILYGESGIELGGIGGKIEDNVIIHTHSDSSLIYAIDTNCMNFESWRNNTIHNTSYTHPTSAAVYFAREKVIIGDNITNYTTAYRLGSDSSNTVFYNTTITGGDNATRIDGADNVSFFNCTFNKSSMNFESGVSDIRVFHPIRINVTNSSYSPLSGTNVNISNSTSVAPMIEDVTDASGLTSWHWVEEYNQTNDAVYVDGCLGSDANITCFNPFNVTVTLDGYDMNSTNFSVIIQQTDNVILALVTCEYSGSGDWNVSTSCTVTSQVVVIESDKSVHIESGGDLTLQNVSLHLKPYSNGSAEIRVWPGGSLTIEAVSNDGSLISVNTTEKEEHYNFTVMAGSQFSMTDSRLEEAGWDAGNPGLLVDVPMGSFSGNTLTKNYFGINILENNNTLSNNNISYNTWGIHLKGSGNTTIVNNTIQNNSKRGINIYGADNTVVINSTVSGNDLGINLYNSDNVLIWNSQLIDNYNDTYVMGTGNMTLLNTSLNKSTMNYLVTSSGLVYVTWYLDVLVKNSLGQPISSALVSVMNTTSDVIFSEYTSINGNIQRKNVTEFKENNGGKLDVTPHVINASRAGVTDTNTTNITESMIIELLVDIYHSAQYKLKLNNSATMIYTPYLGEMDGSSVNPLSSFQSANCFIVAYGDILDGLVSSSCTSLNYESDGSTPILGIIKNMTNTKTLLPSTQGTWRDVDNRMDIIKSGDFFLEIKPTFGFGLGYLYPIKVILEYANDIEIAHTELTLRKGVHKLELESYRMLNGSKNITITNIIG